MSEAFKCYQCMDKGLLIVPTKGKNDLIYDYMYQCSCSKGHYYKQLPQIDIKDEKNREFLKKLAIKNYEQYQDYKKNKKTMEG